MTLLDLMSFVIAERNQSDSSHPISLEAEVLPVWGDTKTQCNSN